MEFLSSRWFSFTRSLALRRACYLRLVRTWRVLIDVKGSDVVLSDLKGALMKWRNRSV